MKKWLKISFALILALAIALGATSCAAGTTATAKDDSGKIENTDIEWNYKADSKKLVISGEGEIPDLAVKDVPWKAYRASIEEISIGSDITKIGNNAFAFCQNATKVSVPSKVESIGDSAFEACGKLEAIEIPTAVTSLGERVFAHCTSLEEIIVLGEISEIKSWAFKGCKSLDSLAIYCPDGQEIEVAEDAFLECAIENLDDDGVELRANNTTDVEIIVNYVYENGDEAADAVTVVKHRGESYKIESPEIEGYEPDESVVEGTVESLTTIKETVTYKQIEVEETEDTTEVGGAEAPDEGEADTEDKKVNAGTIVAIVVFAIAIIALVVFAIFMFRSDKNDKNKKGGAAKNTANEKNSKNDKKKK